MTKDMIAIYLKKYKIEIIECKHLSDLIQNAFY